MLRTRLSIAIEFFQKKKKFNFKIFVFHPGLIHTRLEFVLVSNVANNKSKQKLYFNTYRMECFKSNCSFFYIYI